MENIKVTKSFDGRKVGEVLSVTTATANKRVKDGLAEFIKKEAKEAFETKEEKIVTESKSKKATKKATKAPK